MPHETFSIDQLKTAYNLSLAAARKSAEEAAEYREAIEARAPEYRGRSRGRVLDAKVALYEARTFAATPGDLPEAMNPHR